MSLNVVADHLQIPREGGKYLGKGKLVRKGMKVSQNYVDTINENTSTNGKLMVVDVEATEAFRKEQAENNAKRSIDAETSKLDPAALIAAFMSAGQVKSEPVKVEKAPKAEKVLKVVKSEESENSEKAPESRLTQKPEEEEI